MADIAKLGLLIDSRDAKTANERLDRFVASGMRAEGTTKSLTGTARGLAVSLGAAGVAGAAFLMSKAFTKSISLGKDFTTQLSDLSAITGIVDEQLDDIGERALQASERTGRSATEIVDAYKLVASQLADKIDFSTSTGQGVLQQVAEDAVTLSQAARIDLAQAVDATTTAINQFNLSAEQSAEVINNLAAGSKFGAAEVANIQAALTEAGSAAAGAGEDLTTTNAAIQVLAANAITGSRAGTGLRNVFLRLQTESEKLAQHGIKDINIQSDGLTGTLQKLTPLLGDAGALTDIFGQEAFNTASILIRNVDTLDRLEGKLSDTNTAYEQQSVQMDNLTGDIARLSGAVESDLTQSFLEGESSFRNFVQTAIDLWGEFGDDFISVMNFAVDQSTAAIHRWGDVFRDEMQQNIDFAEDSIPLILLKFNNWIARQAFNEIPRFLVKEFVTDPFNAVRNAIDNEEPIQIGQGVLAIDEDAVTTPLDGVLDSVRLLGRGYGVLRTEAMEAGDALQDSSNNADTARESFTDFTTELKRLDPDQLTLVNENLLGSVQQQLTQIERLGRIFDNYDVGRAKASLLRGEIESLVMSGQDHTATLNELIFLYNQLGLEGAGSVQEIVDGLDEARENLDQMTPGAQNLGFILEDAAAQAMIEWENFGAIAQGVLRDILAELVRINIARPFAQAITGALTSGDGFFSTLFGGGKAHGGPVESGKLYAVGERGPELFAPGRNGAIIPNHKMGGDVNVIINNHSGAEIETTQRQNPDGSRDIEVFVGNMVKGMFNEGRMDGVMSRNYQLSRRGRV